MSCSYSEMKYVIKAISFFGLGTATSLDFLR